MDDIISQISEAITNLMEAVQQTNIMAQRLDSLAKGLTREEK